MKKSFIRNIFLQISTIICSFFLISSTGCEPTDPVKVVIHTDFGDMIIELSDSTPGHRDNFIKLANEGFYDSLLFHRVMEGFMIQGGDPDSKDALPGQRLGSGGPGYTIPAEMRADHLHVKGALAAARQGDSSNPTRASSGSQFYIVHGKTFTGEELDNSKAIVTGSNHENTSKRVNIKEKLNSSEKNQFNTLINDSKNLKLLNIMSNICYKKVNRDQKGLGVFMDILFRSCEQ